MSKLLLSAVGLLGVGAGAFGAWVSRPAHEPGADAEQLVVLRDIQRELEAIRESMGAATLPPATTQGVASIPQGEPQVQPLISDLQQALAQLIAESGQLQAAASAGGLVADGAGGREADEHAVSEALALISRPGPQQLVRDLFGLSPAAAYRRFGTPTFASAEGGTVQWSYYHKGAPTLTLTFTDGYLLTASRSK